MFDINGFELAFIALLAVILIGPDRLPQYVNGLRAVVKRVRSFIQEGRTQLNSEFGEDFDWSDYDPRQYDPRRIVRDALLEDEQEIAASPRRARRAATAANPIITPGGTPVAAAAVADPVVDSDPTPTLGNPAIPKAPFDPEAT